MTFTVHCSKGTYIRSLCRDIGETLGCGATMTALIREEVHGVKLEDCYRLSEIEHFMKSGTIMNYLKPMDDILLFMDCLYIKDEYMKYLAYKKKHEEKIQAILEFVYDPHGELVLKLVNILNKNPEIERQILEERNNSID